MIYEEILWFLDFQNPDPNLVSQFSLVEVERSLLVLAVSS